ncbi:hypothetical protein, partial [Klebsiella aerogenes]|uniref:hypothetical protein n=1 Tax=Klebsiella aerogenes TaxID=548 RepID=UPI001954BA55
IKRLPSHLLEPTEDEVVVHLCAGQVPAHEHLVADPTAPQDGAVLHQVDDQDQDQPVAGSHG